MPYAETLMFSNLTIKYPPRLAQIDKHFSVAQSEASASINFSVLLWLSV